MKSLLLWAVALLGVAATRPGRRELAKLTLYFAENVAYKQEHEMLSLGRLNRQLQRAR